MSAGAHWRVALAVAVALAIALDVRAQPSSSVDRELATLYARLEQTLKMGDRAALMGLLAPDDKAAAEAFAAQQVLSGATHAVVRERDRAPILGAPADSGFHVLLDVFVEFGQRGSARTWKLDVLRSSTGSGEVAARWVISAPEHLASVEGLYRLGLDRTKQFRIRNLRVSAEDLTITIPSGVAFGAVTADGPTAFVLLGRGEVRFTPKQESEQGQIRIFTDEDVLRTRIDGAFLRLHPWDVRDRLSEGSLTEMLVDARDLRRADEVFAEEIGKSFGLDLSDLSRDQWSLVPPMGDFLAEIRTRRFGTLTYARSGNEPEDITLFDRKRRRNISVYASASKLASRGSRFYSEDDDADYDVQHYGVQAHFDPRREWIDGRVEIRLRVRAAAIGTLTLRLAEPLVVRAVTSPGLGRLLTLRVKGQNSVIVNLPRTVPRDAELVLHVMYSGRLPGATPDREAMALGQNQIIQEHVTIPPEARLLYTNRSYWYPQAPVTDFATAVLRLTMPEDQSCVASGVPASGNPVRLDGPTALEKRRLYVFVVDRPTRYLSVVLTRLETALMVTLPSSSAPEASTADATTTSSESAPAGVSSLPLAILANPRQMGRARSMQEHVTAVWSTYADIIGEFPYPAFTLALVDDPLPGGHSPAYFAILHQPLPTSPYSWRNDPVSFDGFPQFFLAHEIAHQFWGNAVGWENYHEQWISEGFAQYFAVLYAERTQSRGNLENVLRQLRRTAAANARHGAVWLGYRLGHLQGDGRIFRALVYNKGALVLHMLRRLLGDEAFFRGLRRFYRESRFQKVGTGHVQRAFEAESGQPLGRFFERWILGADTPVLRMSYRVEDSAVGSMGTHGLTSVRPSGQSGSARSPQTRSAATASGAGSAVVVRFEQIGDVFDVPVTVTLAYTSGQSDDVLVRVTEAVVETRMPLRGTLREIEVNRDNAALVDVRRN